MWFRTVLAVVGGWVALAVALALLLGRTIGTADRRRREEVRTERPRRARARRR